MTDTSSTPQHLDISLEISPEAQLQLELMARHDPALTNAYMRMHISGKGCEGFKYSMGLAQKHPDDLEFTLWQKDELKIRACMDPFSANYLRQIKIDYYQAYDEEGFTITNCDENQFQGKFWLKDQSKIPHHLKKESKK